MVSFKSRTTKKWERNHRKRMEIKRAEKKDQATFNDFVENHPLGTIHQLYEWGEFQAKSSNRDKFWTLVAEDKGKIVGSALVVRHRLPFGKSWLYCPRGPLLDYSNKAESGPLFAEIAEIAKKENAIFLRIDPPHLKGSAPDLKGARTAHAHYQPESTLTIDLSPTEEEILKQMKSKGRYNIKVAQKHGVEIKESQDIEGFYKIFQQTTQRDHFSGHSLQYYQNILNTLGSKRAKLYLATYKGTAVAGAVITYCAKTATYYFGASSNEHRNVMAPYLLHWKIMQDAKAAGYKEYDLFGIAPEEAKNHRWAGVTQFKLKFGGARVNYADAQEIVYQPVWYWLMTHLKGIL